MQLMNIPVAVAVEDNKISFTATKIPGGDLFGDTFKIRFDMLVNGNRHTAETELMCIHELKFVAVARDTLSAALQKATQQLFDRAVNVVILELGETIRGGAR